MAKRPTVYDVAHAAGVSIATVSFTFRQPERVRASTREAVLEAARTLNYVPSASARGLAESRTGALGLYSFDMLLESGETGATRPVREDPGAFFAGDVTERAFSDDADDEDFRVFPLYVDEVQRGFELECARRGRALMIGRGPSGDGAGVIDIASRVDGLAVFPWARSEDVLDQLAHRLPVVAFAMPYGAGALHHVRVDNAGGVRILTEHLVREHGITRIEFVGSPEMSDYAERFEGMRAALRDLGLPVPREVLDPTPIAAESPFPVIRDLLDRGEVPRGLVCASDQHALDLMALLRDRGCDVPGDVAVTGFDGVAAGRLFAPSLTTARQPMEAMGRLAVDILMDSIADPDAPPVDRTLPVRPLFRESCGCPARR
ncbi:LacI family DNA-binding transcriptional regulator [Actinotalea sp. K2]|uniref:LacI family DNA-binding transcriptional regulator n=1 Tax=Actinotalea sp. K2 TaxID=2939438 RepID=UPI00201762A6|nr:LacI family DNA-binding transcriptional regulator [Actinotalea sp. K2]MCL3861233.1 LacI family transcriptional regulator [Actinotalea sp. K2]